MIYDMNGSATGTIAIDVQYLPTKIGDTRYFAEIGHSVVLKLTVDANPLPVIFGEWKLGHVALNKTDSSSTSSATITEVQPEHFGNYNVSVENDVGVVSFIVSLEPPGVPEAPSLQLVAQDYTNLTILIMPGHNGGDEGNVFFTLEYRLYGYEQFNPWQSSTTSVVIVVFDLQSGSVYGFQAYAENRFGKSEISDTYKFNTYETEINLSSTFNKDEVGSHKTYEVIDNEGSANITSKKTTKKDKVESTYTDLMLSDRPEDAYTGLSNERPKLIKEEAASPYEALNPQMIAESVYMKCGETSFEYPRDRLSTRSVLHDGNRHRIVLCKAWHIGGKDGASEVAVKMANGKTKSKEESDIMNESILMRKISNHPNIVKLLGVCTNQGPTYIIMEYLFQGSLDTFLQEVRSSSARDQSVTERELLSFALDIGRGMEHLANLKIVHRFLSSKHVLVDDSLRCKISNFGYTTEVIDDQSFYEKSKVSCPERYMAVESFSMTFTEKSDVWSFGVVLWQITTLGDTPYESLNAYKIERKLKSGHRLQKPGSCGRFAYDQMMLCWQKEPRDRPSFSKLVKKLNTLKNKEKEFMDISSHKESTYAVIK
ncbi:proto-oncogene tyrosine-protein kinase receptor Ret-like [Ptychodera flava]|uniref:proto-oncogene tyrosine-protein kinase receptor Ret-like n=1 Tax=Ptychodera flava TaxID=63121 RepID=UPI00396A2289